MGTVSKEIADNIIRGLYPEDNIVKIVKYTDMAGGEAYGIITEGHDLNTYRETEFVQKPVTYWRRPSPPLPTPDKVFSALTKKSGGWTAEDHFSLPNNYQLHITTSKQFNGQLLTSALVGRVEHREGYSSFMYKLGLGGGGDYYRKLLATDIRVTEKAVRDQQVAAIAACFDAVLADVVDHYDGEFAGEEW